eukprot:6476912-Amphidinium_carterae.1
MSRKRLRCACNNSCRHSVTRCRATLFLLPTALFPDAGTPVDCSRHPLPITAHGRGTLRMRLLDDSAHVLQIPLASLPPHFTEASKPVLPLRKNPENQLCLMMSTTFDTALELS